MNVSEFEIKRVLSSLGISYKDRANSKGWLPILCPRHNDTEFGSCSINIGNEYNGVISCFAGCDSFHLTSVIMDRMHCNYYQALDILGAKETEKTVNQNLSNRITLPERPKKNDPTTAYVNKINEEYLEDFDPLDYTYTKLRGFTKEFCGCFGIRKITDKWYKHRIYVPIKDSKQGIQTFEARKLMEEEALQAWLQGKNHPLHVLRQKFREYKKHTRLKYEKDEDGIFTLYQHGKPIPDDDTLIYLIKPKVLYPSGSRIYKTIFNVDNLNRNEDLYLVEGLGSIAKIWEYVTKNVSCAFGVHIVEEQIRILKEFKKKIIIIPDADESGIKMVEYLCEHLNNVFVLISDYEDTDAEYVDTILRDRIINAKEFILDKLNIFPIYK